MQATSKNGTVCCIRICTLSYCCTVSAFVRMTIAFAILSCQQSLQELDLAGFLLSLKNFALVSSISTQLIFEVDYFRWVKNACWLLLCYIKNSVHRDKTKMSQFSVFVLKPVPWVYFRLERVVIPWFGNCHLSELFVFLITICVTTCKDIFYVFVVLAFVCKWQLILDELSVKFKSWRWKTIGLFVSAWNKHAGACSQRRNSWALSGAWNLSHTWLKKTNDNDWNDLRAIDE